MLRKHLINHDLIDSTIVFDGLVFEEANVDTSIIHLNSFHKTNSFYWGKIQPNNLESIKFFPRDCEEIANENRYEIFEYLGETWKGIKAKIKLKSIPLSELRKISLGMKLKGNSNYIVSEKTESHPDNILFGKDLGYYEKPKRNNYFSWTDSLKIGGTQRHEVYLSNPKILIQAIRNLSLERRIVATIDEETSYFIGTVNGLTKLNSSTDFIIDEYFLLAIINSKLINFFFKSQFTTISLTASFLGVIPVKITDEKTQKDIGDNVRILMSSKNDEARKALIDEIDNSVFELYDLTEKEVQYIKKANA
ncbi:TaqI-like C-terminal specificity domain-containing protein [Winogradskyella rapida]|uniref:site-specific DNA-methyltransferase (adenine-specific) n=1 Tax=Winogradskyella rapida TaxID=549701 RepID=A0ABW3KS42_9FLAO